LKIRECSEYSNRAQFEYPSPEDSLFDIEPWSKITFSNKDFEASLKLETKL